MMVYLQTCALDSFSLYLSSTPYQSIADRTLPSHFQHYRPVHNYLHNSAIASRHSSIPSLTHEAQELFGKHDNQCQNQSQHSSRFSPMLNNQEPPHFLADGH